MDPPDNLRLPVPVPHRPPALKTPSYLDQTSRSPPNPPPVQLASGLVHRLGSHLDISSRQGYLSCCILASRGSTHLESFMISTTFADRTPALFRSMWLTDEPSSRYTWGTGRIVAREAFRRRSQGKMTRGGPTRRQQRDADRSRGYDNARPLYKVVPAVIVATRRAPEDAQAGASATTTQDHSQVDCPRCLNMPATWTRPWHALHSRSASPLDQSSRPTAQGITQMSRLRRTPAWHQRFTPFRAQTKRWGACSWYGAMLVPSFDPSWFKSIKNPSIPMSRRVNESPFRLLSPCAPPR